jgi:hypothetical protein
MGMAILMQLSLKRAPIQWNECLTDCIKMCFDLIPRRCDLPVLVIRFQSLFDIFGDRVTLLLLNCNHVQWLYCATPWTMLTREQGEDCTRLTTVCLHSLLERNHNQSVVVM